MSRVAPALSPLGDLKVPVREPGSDLVPIIHFVCDRVFEGQLGAEEGHVMVKALIGAGANPDARVPRHGDSNLISAVSLNCPDIALTLIEADSDVRVTGLFGATALHWAAMLGQPDVVDRLIRAGAEVNIEDGEYGATPIGWAIHGWTNGNTPRRQPECARRLIEAGGVIHGVGLVEKLKGTANTPMREALGLDA